MRGDDDDVTWYELLCGYLLVFITTSPHCYYIARVNSVMQTLLVL